MRFIPACAGNVTLRDKANNVVPVHPRVCGERWSRSRWEDRLIGSSPRVRGTCVARQPIPGRKRFIPACAGNVEMIESRIKQATVHPRVCGERLLAVSAAAVLAGSSPRVRGTWPSRDQYLVR